MKLKIFTLLTLVLLVCISCSNDDKVELDKIVGEWNWDTTYPYPIMDVSETYIFRENNTFVKTIYSFESPGLSMVEGSYQISVTGTPRVLSLHDGDKYIEQFYIRKLDSKEMILEPTDENETLRQKKLIKE